MDTTSSSSCEQLNVVQERVGLLCPCLWPRRPHIAIAPLYNRLPGIWYCLFLLIQSLCRSFAHFNAVVQKLSIAYELGRVRSRLM